LVIGIADAYPLWKPDVGWNRVEASPNGVAVLKVEVGLAPDAIDDVRVGSRLAFDGEAIRAFGLG
jgi:hypothetical protein